MADSLQLPPEHWLDFLACQSEQTYNTRRYLFRRIGLRSGVVVEPGCGAGAALADLLKTRPELTAIGVDIDPTVLRAAPEGIERIVAPAEKLPLADSIADAVLFHFSLMWVNPRQALAEAFRILKPRGHLILAGEPDYGGMLSHPDPGDKKTMVSKLRRGIARVNGDPDLGRRIGELASGAGFEVLETGMASKPRRYGKENLEELAKLFRFRQMFHPRSTTIWERFARKSAQRNGYLEFLPVFYLLGKKA
ncbi:class I SAM-dependent methyltransferase [bacterium]|nr:class I SAM-dependent methyltransferase [bacterium]